MQPITAEVDLDNEQANLTTRHFYPFSNQHSHAPFQLNFDFKGADRIFLQQCKGMEREQMWQELECKRLDELKIKSGQISA